MSRTSFNSFNHVVITGNMVSDPSTVQVRNIGTDRNGNPIQACTITIAFNERKKEGDQWIAVPNYFDVEVTGSPVKLLQEYAPKGSPVTVAGRLRQDRWTDKNTGENRYKVKIAADTIDFHTNSKNNQPTAQSQPTKAQEPVTVAANFDPGDDDLIP